MNGPFPYDMLTDEQYKTYLKRIHPQSGSTNDEKIEACGALGRFMNPKAVEHIAAAIKHEIGLPPLGDLGVESNERDELRKSSLIYAMIKCVQPNHIPVLIELIESTKDDSYVALLDGLRLCSNRAWMQNDESSAKRVAVYLSNLATNGSHSFRHSARRTLLDMALGMEKEGLYLVKEEIHHVISFLKSSSDTTAQIYAVRFSDVIQNI